MQIKLNDLEPEFARRLTTEPHAEMALSAVNPRPPAGQQFLRALGAGDYMAMAYLVGLVVMGGMVQAKLPDPLIIAFFAAVVFGAPALAIAWFRRKPLWPFRRRRAEKTRGALTPELLATLTAAITPSEAEKAYVDSVRAMLELDKQMDEPTAQRILGQLNALLESSYQLEHQRQGLAVTLGPNTLRELEAKREELAQELNETSDTMAREIARQSLEICEGRLASMEALEPIRERVDAQQEVIVQTLLSLQTALTHMRIAPAETAPPDVEAVRDTISQIQRQARSVEQAVAEVATLR